MSCLIPELVVSCLKASLEAEPIGSSLLAKDPNPSIDKYVDNKTVGADRKRVRSRPVRGVKG
jgi:hypothetical protein